MKFGAVPVTQAEGGVAVHSIRQSGLVLKKGTLIGKPEIAALQAAGISEIVVARIEPGDVSEDAAAAEIAAAVAGTGVRVDRAFTGRANLFAEGAGVLVVDKDAIDRLCDPCGLQARGRGRDDRHGQDHPVCGRRKGA
jgi:molybdenum cofactor cytidylyltransferase